jgi:hypothetical protein
MTLRNAGDFGAGFLRQSLRKVRAAVDSPLNRRSPFHIAYNVFRGWLIRLLLIVACLAFGFGHILKEGCSKSAAEAMRRELQRYSARYVDAVRLADRDGRDLLASYAAFADVWKDVSPNEPMRIQTVSPASVDSDGRELVPVVIRAPRIIDAESFREFRIVLDDLRELIVEGNGTGRGLLRDTHFDAEPASDWLPLSPGERGTK